MEQPVAGGSEPPTPRLGALGAEIARIQTRPFVVVLLATAAVVIGGGWFGLPAAAQALAPVLGPVVTIWLMAALCILALVVATGVVAAVPPLLVSPADRSASAVNVWVGAREVRRVLGAATSAVELPTTPEDAERWLAATPSTDHLRAVRIEVLLMARRFAEAREEAAKLPAGTPIERYRQLEAEALVDDQAGAPFDEALLRDAVARIPPGVDRAEAAAGLATILARRSLPAGDWRAPLLEARPLIKASDAAILFRDLGAPVWTILLRRVVLPVALLIAGIATLFTLNSGR